MVTIDVPTCMALGAGVALRNRALLATAPERLRYRALLLTLFGFTPLGQLFDLYFHDWQWQYVSPTLPPYASMLFVAAMNASGLFCFELARRWLLAGNARAAWTLALGASGFSGVYSLFAFRRVFWVGAYGEWAAGSAPSMFARQDFLGLLGVSSLLLTVAMYVWLWRPAPAAA